MGNQLYGTPEFFGMLKKIVNGSKGLLLVIGCAKAIDLSVNDGWGDAWYSFKKLFATRDKNSVKKKVVVLGTGWGALSFINHLDQDSVDLVIVSPRSFFFYTPLLAGVASGTVSYSSIMEPIRWYCERAKHSNAKYFQAECIDINVDDRQITCNALGKEIFSLSYDELVVAVGADTATFGIPGIQENCIFMKEVENAVNLQQKLLRNLEKASGLLRIGGHDQEVQRLLTWTVIGGGPSGVELAAELSDFIQQDISLYFPEIADRVTLTLMEATGTILGYFDKRVAEYATNRLHERGVKVNCNCIVTKVTADTVYFKEKVSDSETADRQSVFGAAVWAGGVTTRPVVRRMIQRLNSSEQSSKFGLAVNGKFQVRGAERNGETHVWALGDCAVTGCSPTAQAALQQGTFLGRLFRDTLLDPVKVNAYPDFHYVNKGAMTYVGGNKAVAELKTMLWDSHPQTGSAALLIEGYSAFALWRSLYFSRLLSGRNRCQVIYDWVRTSIFGREISSPNFESNPVA